LKNTNGLTYTAICENCGYDFTFNEKDIERGEGWNRYAIVRCPNCKTCIDQDKFKIKEKGRDDFINKYYKWIKDNYGLT